MNSAITINSRTLLRDFKSLKRKLYFGDIQVILVADGREKKLMELRMVNPEKNKGLSEACRKLRAMGKGVRVRNKNVMSFKNLFPRLYGD